MNAKRTANAVSNHPATFSITKAAAILAGVIAALELYHFLKGKGLWLP